MRKISVTERRLPKFRTLAGFSLCLIGGISVFSIVGSALASRAQNAPAAPFTPAGANWTIVNSANGSVVNDIVALTCVSNSDCWGVGRQRAGSIWQTLIEHWNGNSWTLVSSPNTSTSDDNFLYGVACTSATQCWAVGNHSIVSNFGFAQPLIERWDGTSWTIDNSLQTSPEQQDAILSGVTCNSASDCWAVGLYVLTDFNQTLVEHWDGTSWNVVTSANTSARESNRLSAVTCTSASDCWAVGFRDVGTPVNGAAPWATLIEHWDGTSWSIVVSPNAPSNTNVLASVTCTSASDCEAVGHFAVGIFFQTLVEHWDGNGWTVISSPNPTPNDDNVLNWITCNSASDCLAVGYFNAGDVNNPLDQTLIEHWNGTAWAVVDSPNRDGFQFNFLNAVTCVSASECWAAGVSDTPNAITLVEHYSISPVPVFQVVSRMTHGDAGPFDVLLLGQDPPPPNFLGIECRSGVAGGNYELVFTFVNALTSVNGASMTTGTGSVARAAIDPNDAHNYIVTLTGVTNAQVITVSLSSVTDSVGNFSSSVPVSMGVLLGDVNASRQVDGNDVSAIQSYTRQSVDNTNFRYDVNTTGGIDGNDVSMTQAQTRTALP